MEKDPQYLKTCCSEQPESVGDVFDILRKLEIDSLDRGEFAQAENAKNKFNRLREEQAKHRQGLLQAKNK